VGLFYHGIEDDPEFPTHKANYREFLYNVSQFRHPIPIRNAVILSKIHHTYRLQFMKDVVLARALDDSTLNVLNSCIIFNQIDIITFVQLTPSFLRDVVTLYVNEETMKSDTHISEGPVQKFTDFTGPGQDFSEWTDTLPPMTGQQGPNGVDTPAPTDDAYAFAPPEDLSEQDFALRAQVLSLVLHLCSMAKNVQLASRLALFRTLIDRGILFAVQWALGLPEKDDKSKVIISNAGEILSALLDHDLNGVRGHVLKQVVAIDMERQAKKRGAEKAETILALMCRVLTSSRDLAVQSQVGDALKSLLDVPQDDGVNTHVCFMNPAFA
jgi:protein phosphatase-4 regulatory subunit 3